jgi:hypothetical protein
LVRGAWIERVFHDPANPTVAAALDLVKTGFRTSKSATGPRPSQRKQYGQQVQRAIDVCGDRAYRTSKHNGCAAESKHKLDGRGCTATMTWRRAVSPLAPWLVPGSQLSDGSARGSTEVSGGCEATGQIGGIVAQWLYRWRNRPVGLMTIAYRRPVCVLCDYLLRMVERLARFWYAIGRGVQVMAGTAMIRFGVDRSQHNGWVAPIQ